MANTPTVRETIQRETAKRRTGTPDGPTVRVRAIRTGQYGYPLPWIRNVGQEFDMFVSDLLAFTKRYPPPTQGQKTPKDYMGAKVQYVTVGKERHALPTWCEDASAPSSIAEVEDDGSSAVSTQPGDDVL